MTELLISDSQDGCGDNQHLSKDNLKNLVQLFIRAKENRNTRIFVYIFFST